MSSFGVKPDKLNICVDSMKNSMQAIRRAGADVLNVSRNLPFIYNGHEQLSAKIAGQSEAITRTETAISNLIKSLTEIAALYKKTERSTADTARAAAGSYDKAAIAASAGGAGAGGAAGADDLIRKAMRDMTIGLQEALDPETAKLVNDFLDGGENNQLTDEEKMQIKEKIYNAKEPFRTAYLRYLERYSMGDMDVGEKEPACYNPGNRTVNYNYSDNETDSFNDDPRGPYTVFFHESGHAIDDLADVASEDGYDTSDYKHYSDAMGRDVTLREAIDFDVYYNRSNPHSVTSMANEIMEYNKSCQGADLDTVINAMKSGDTSSLSDANRNLFNSIVDQYNGGIGEGAKYEAVSDVYGGYTHNALCNGYHHDNSYWDIAGEDGPAKELWAEYFSYNMADSTENLEHLREYFPEASRICDMYANKLAD